MIRRLKGFPRKALLAVGIGTAVLLFAGVAGAGSNFNNGGFEIGDNPPSYWGVTGAGAGSWFVSDKTITPVTGFGWFGPAEKEWAAVTDMPSSGTQILYRYINLGNNGKKGKLSMLVYYKNHAGVWCDPGTIDYSVLACNEQYRIDILQPAASLFSDDPGDVLMTIFHTKSNSAMSMKPKRLTVSLKGLSGSVLLRLVAVENEDVLNASVDDVRLDFGG